MLVVGIAAALSRAYLIAARQPGDPILHPRDELSIRMFSGVLDPTTGRRDIEDFEQRYIEHPAGIMTHVLASAAFMILAGLQFSARFRNRHRAVHRWSGRFLLLMIFLITTSAFYYALFMPFGGFAETTAVLAFGIWMLFCATTAWAAIRNGDVNAHRRWMTRMFAVALGISLVRLMTVPLLILFDGFQNAFGPSLWIGWMLSALGAEVWLRTSRKGFTFSLAMPSF